MNLTLKDAVNTSNKVTGKPDKSVLRIPTWARLTLAVVIGFAGGYSTARLMRLIL